MCYILLINQVKIRRNMIQSLLQFDRHLFFMINGFHHPVADLFFRIITQLGNGWFVGPLLTVIVWRNVPHRYFGRVFVVSVIGLSLCGIFNSQLKRVVKRPRPFKYFAMRKTDSPDSASTGGLPKPYDNVVRVLGPKYRNRSFPSGHTNTAFSAAAFLVILFGRVYLFAFIPALLVGYSRIYLGVHFPFDVIAGAILGSVMIWGYFLLAARLVKKVIPRKYNRHDT